MNVIFIGMPGVGKTQLGKAVADKIGYEFVDTDFMMEASSGMQLQELLNTLGEDGFITFEQATLADLSFVENTIIATGGSVVYADEVLKSFSATSLIVYLKVSYETLASWNIDYSNRGTVGIVTKGLKGVYDERAPMYERHAGFTIELKADYVLAEVAGELAKVLLEKLQ